MENLTSLEISQELRNAVKSYLAAKAAAAKIRPIVESYQREILVEMQAVSEFDGSLIVEPKDAYQMDDELFSTVYFPRVEAAAKAAGFDVPADCCPLLIAEDKMRKAGRNAVDAAEYITGLTADRIIKLEDYKKILEILEKLVGCK